MKLLIVTQKVDMNDPILGFFHRWIAEFAKEASGQKVTVICLSKGEYDLPENVKVISLGKERGGSRIRFVARFFASIWRERKEYDTVFVHMNPEYVVLAGVFWRMLSKKIFLWYVHRSVTWRLHIAHFFAHGIFSSTPESFRIKNSKASFVGHAIPVEQFARPHENQAAAAAAAVLAKPLRVVSVGRITPIKRHEMLIDAVGILRERGVAVRASIVGSPIFPKDKMYYGMLRKKVAAQKLEREITFVPAVPPHEIANWYWNNDLLINLCPTGGLDKVVLEAMAAGTPVMVANEAFRPCLGRYENNLSVKEATAENLASKVQDFLRDFGGPAEDAAGNTELIKLKYKLQGEAGRFSLPAVIHQLYLEMAAPRNSFILMYHSVGNNPHAFTVSAAHFEEQIETLRRKGYYFESLTTLINRLRKGESIRGAVVITFDDGYRDNFSEAFPILKKYNAPATIFVTTDFVSGQPAANTGVAYDLAPLTLSDMQEMVNSRPDSSGVYHNTGLIDIMPHSASHKKLHGISYDEAVKEIEKSRAWIEEEKLTIPADIFAFPKGRYTSELIRYLRNSNGRWSGAVTVVPGYINAKTDPFLLPRIAVDSTTTSRRFEFKISPLYAWYRRFVSILGR